MQHTETPVSTYLALGDSYTIGEAVATTERFPVQLVDSLQKQGTTFKTPDIIAVTGWTTRNLLDAIAAQQPSNNYDLVTLLIGVNNQYQGKPISEYETEFTTLLHQAIAFANNNKKHVVVVSIPDYSITPFAANMDKAKIASEIDAFNADNKRISLAAGVNYVDITPISRSNEPGLVATDGLHPSALQYSKWVALITPVVKANL